MQHPDGTLEQFNNEEELQTAVEALQDEIDGMENGPKVAPTFRVGEVIPLKGGKFKVAKILSRGRIHLKSIGY